MGIIIPPTPQQTCIFCGDSPTTLEHIVPVWAGEVLARTKPAPSQPDKIVVAQHKRWSDAPHLDIDQEWITKNQPEFRVKCVCGRCNQGWMSTIESDAAPFITEMMEDGRLALDTQAQAIVAKWLALKAVVAQYGLPTTHILPEWEAALARDGTPPHTWQIRAARYTGETPMLMAFGVLDTTLLHRLVPFIVRQQGFLFVIQLGRFIGQVIGVRQQGLITINRSRFIQISPHPLLRDNPQLAELEPQLWPPERGLSDSDIQKCVKDPTEPRD